MVRANFHYLRKSSNLQSTTGILHVDYEALLPYLNESIKKNYQDISNIRTENEHIQKSIDILYAEFVKREAIVKYQHQPGSMFSDHAQTRKAKHDTSHDRKRTPIWQWLLFVLAGAVLFISGAVAIYFVVYQDQSQNTPLSLTPIAGPPVPRVLDRDTDKRVLEELFMATGGANWTSNYGWLTSLDMCTWYGVHCSSARVVQISLANNGLRGTIPPVIAYLDLLGMLSLSGNDISGTLPAGLFELPSLRKLELAYNPRLSGTIPSAVDPPVLGLLYAHGCNLTGNVPTWLTGSKVEDLQLQENRLTGQLPVLPRGLLRGNFQSNQLEGTVPRYIGYVGDVNLANNRLTGTLDAWQVINAGSIILANNSLSGQFPLTNSQWQGVRILDISNNQFTSVRSDLLPPPQLQTCNASNNPFKCPIPKWLVTRCGATCK